MTKNEEVKILNRRGTRVVMTLILSGITYGFASLAIDSGSLFEYFATIVFFAWTIKSAVRAIRPQQKRGPTLEKDR